jgi:L-fuconolactonase
VRAHQIGDLVHLAARYPELRIVLDHGGKPDIAGGAFIRWAAATDALARQPNVHCKLSGLWTEAGGDISAEAIRPYAAHLLAVFGPERLMWGSDWPVVELAGSYADWFEQAELLLAGLSSADRARVFGGNAAHFYRLDNG